MPPGSMDEAYLGRFYVTKNTRLGGVYATANIFRPNVEQNVGLQVFDSDILPYREGPFNESPYY